jgi:hypothetical protein
MVSDHRGTEIVKHSPEVTGPRSPRLKLETQRGLAATLLPARLVPARNQPSDVCQHRGGYRAVARRGTGVDPASFQDYKPARAREQAKRALSGERAA